MSECRSCKAPLRWATTEVGRKAMPLDRDPNPDGNVVLVRDRMGIDKDNRSRVARVLGPLEVAALDATTDRFMPHHATCPSWGA